MINEISFKILQDPPFGCNLTPLYLDDLLYYRNYIFKCKYSKKIPSSLRMININWKSEIILFIRHTGIKD